MYIVWCCSILRSPVPGLTFCPGLRSSSLCQWTMAEQCSLAFSIGTEGEEIISVDGTKLPVDIVSAVLGRSKVLSELAAVAKESGAHTSCAVPILPSAFWRWASFGSTEYSVEDLSCEDLIAIVQVCWPGRFSCHTRCLPYALYVPVYTPPSWTVRNPGHAYDHMCSTT